MSGLELYTKYQDELAKSGVDVDAFRDLDLVDREAWDAVGDQVELKEKR